MRRMLSYFAVLFLSGLVGCSCEEYQCDDTGCYYCDGLGCRPADPDDAPNDCDAEHPCAGDLVCSAGVCQTPDAVCRFDHQCGAGRACVDGRCLGECDAARPCAAGLACEDGVCVHEEVPAECSATSGCDAGLCVDGECSPSCSTDAQCGEGRYCDDGACRIDDRPRPFCMDDAGCQPGHPCIDGLCRTPCSTHAECLMFDVQFNFCKEAFCVTEREATSNCATNVDCAAGLVCRDGICD